MYNFNVKVDQRPFLTLGHIFAKPKDRIAKEEMKPGWRQTMYRFINNNIWHLHSLSIDESRSWLWLGNSSVVKIYIIRPKQGPVAKNATPRPSSWESNWSSIQRTRENYINYRIIYIFNVFKNYSKK